MSPPIAWVPVHPRLGPLWANATPEPDPERLPASYPLMPLYSASPGDKELDSLRAQVSALRGLYATVHDRLLRGDSDCELLNLLEKGWAGMTGAAGHWEPEA